MKDIINQLQRKIIRIILFTIIGLPLSSLLAQVNEQADNQDKTTCECYDEMQRKLASGWNTWDTRSVLTHVYLFYGFAVDLSLIDSDGVRVNRFLIGDRSEGAPLLHPGPHSYDGTYTDINVDWNEHY